MSPALQADSLLLSHQENTLCSGPPKSAPIFLRFIPLWYTCVILHLPMCLSWQWLCKFVTYFIKNGQLGRIVSVLEVNHELHHQSQMRTLLLKLYPHGTYKKQCLSLIFGLHFSDASNFLFRLTLIKCVNCHLVNKIQALSQLQAYNNLICSEELLKSQSVLEAVTFKILGAK